MLFPYSLSSTETVHPRFSEVDLWPRRRVTRSPPLASSSRLCTAEQSLVPSHIHSEMPPSNTSGSGSVLDQTRTYGGYRRAMAHTSVNCWCVIAMERAVLQGKLTSGGFRSCFCRLAQPTSSLSRIYPTSRGMRLRMCSSSIRPSKGCIRCMSCPSCERHSMFIVGGLVGEDLTMS